MVAWLPEFLVMNPHYPTPQNKNFVALVARFNQDQCLYPVSGVLAPC